MNEIVKPWNAYPAIAFRGRDPGDEEFVRLAHEVFAPLLDSVRR